MEPDYVYKEDGSEGGGLSVIMVYLDADHNQAVSNHFRWTYVLSSV